MPPKRIPRRTAPKSSPARPPRAAKRRSSQKPTTPASPLFPPPVPAAWPIIPYLSLAASAYIVLYLVLALLRMKYPYELEWTEGVMLQHVQEILAGRPIYGKPNLHFIPAIYTPMYSYLASGLARLTGPTFLCTRLLSWLGSLGCLGLIFALVRRETGRWEAALFSAGLFAATYRACGAWFDISRVDSVFLCFNLAGIYTLSLIKTPSLCDGDKMTGAWKKRACAVGWIFLAFLTKQSTLFIFAPVLIYLWIWERKGFWWFFLGWGGLVGLSTLFFNTLTQGWYNYYVFSLLSQHPISSHEIVDFWTRDLFATLPVSMLLAGFYLWRSFRKPKLPHRWFMLFLGAGMVGASWSSRIHYGGYDNVLMPAYAWLAMASGMAILEAEQLLRRSTSPKKKAWLFGFYALVGLQLGWLAYSPAAQLPSAADRSAGKMLTGLVRDLPGRVYIFAPGYLAAAAGKEQFAHSQTLADTILYGRPSQTRDDLILSMRRAFSEKYFSAVISSPWDPLFQFFRTEIEGAYPVRGEIMYPGLSFLPVTGMRTRPTTVYALKKPENQTR